MESVMRLSKSRYCRGLQCAKMLWLEKNCPDEADQSSVSQTTLASGHVVGDLAKAYFGPYTEVAFDSPPDFKKMAARTRELMDNGEQVICEATFIFDGDLCLVDILRRDGAGWQLVEVKGASGGWGDDKSGKAKNVYLDDIAFQYRVLTRCGVPVNSTWLMHLDNEYVRGDELDTQALFALEDCTVDVLERQQGIERAIDRIRAVADGPNEPDVEIGPQCDKPYECLFKRRCWGELLDGQNIFTIANLSAATKARAHQAGITTFEDIRAVGYILPGRKSSLNDKQIEQVQCELEQSPASVNRQEIKRFLKSVRFPLYHLDFETYAEAVPPFKGLKPYQQIPFQYSLHIQPAPGSEPEHREFLALEGMDPRRELAERLCDDIPVGACVMVWNDTFEKSRLAELAAAFPDLRDHLMAIRQNIVDLMMPFKQRHYYDWRQHGSYSIKPTLPVFAPELDYANLEGIHNGGDASTQYPLLATMPPEQRAEVRKQLLAYCGQDTYAMVVILNNLYDLVA